MADNLTYTTTVATAPSGTVVATDDVGGAHYQRVKIALGAPNAVDTDLDSGQQTMANSAPVAIASDQTAVPVSASSLPLPTGAATAARQDTGNTALAAIQTAVEIMDDWDESDRAKVNPIVGQAGVAAGAGAVGVTTQRTTLASDDPAVVALQVIDDWDESDRAKVNPIAGQAGVQGGSGTVSANTQRVVLATDVALPAGTNAIGKLAANSGVDIGDVDVTSLPATPAGTNLIGSVNVQLDASTMRDGAGTALTPKFAIVDAATSGDNTLVSAVASKKIRVLCVFLIAAGTVNVRFESGAGGTALTGQMNLVANTGFVLPFSPVGWFETAANTLLNLELSGAVSVDGSLVYVEV